MASPHAFAGYPAPFMHAVPDGDGPVVQHLIWGDYVEFLGEDAGTWTKIRGRNEDGWIRRDDLQDDPLLEVNFIDVGQGDGAFIVTPEDEFLLVDAGGSDNMRRFLSWRFNLGRNAAMPKPIRAAVISHPDADHYYGFDAMFRSDKFRFDAVYHSGIVERAGPNRFGPIAQHGGQRYVADVVRDVDALRQLLADPDHVDGKLYPKMLKAALDGGRVADIRALAAADGYVPGFGPDQDLTLEVLAPVYETIEGRPALRWFEWESKTKNGHSVVIRMRYRNVRILLGGDLNISAEAYLLRHYTGLDPDATEEPQRQALVAAARSIFEVDVAKACHHGSADFTDLFLQAVNPIATVVSSGDDESHAHPRPDTLGAIGKHGRGARPLIFSTELARSTRETIKSANALRDRINALRETIREATTAEERDRAEAALDDVVDELERSIAVFGLINLRTDGHKVVLAQKLEAPREDSGEAWDVHRLEPDADGVLRYRSKY